MLEWGKLDEDAGGEPEETWSRNKVEGDVL